MGAIARQDAQSDRGRLHGPARWGDLQRALRYLDIESAGRVRRAVVAAAVPVVQVALGRIRSRHPRLGLLLRAFDVVRCPSLRRESARRIDPCADDRKRSARTRRFERCCGRRHAAAEHRHCRLPRGVSGRRGAIGCFVLSSQTGRGVVREPVGQPRREAGSGAFAIGRPAASTWMRRATAASRA